MGNRRKARELTLQLLFQKDINHESIDQHIYELLFDQPTSNAKIELFTKFLYSGVLTNILQIDTLIEKHSQHWRLKRMAKVDRNILRMAVFELVQCKDIPPSVTINEAIEIAKKFGSEDTPSFVNGILDNILKHLQKSEPLLLETPEATPPEFTAV
jgi:N utilization substance protein B